MFNSGYRGRRASDNQGTINPQIKYIQSAYPVPTITGYTIAGTDDKALSPAGGQTVLVNGFGFVAGCAAIVNGQTISPVTVVSPNQISFTSPALAGGSYSLVVYNSTGGAAILVPGLIYSSVPTWTTPAGSIGSYYETTAINSAVVATSDSAITYSLASGSLPPGSTLYANGVITGTAPVDSGSTTYTFSVVATDVELQDTTRTFTLTINVDVVTWVTPASGATLNVGSGAVSQTLLATDAAGYAVSYTANALPTGLSLTGNTVTGTANVSGSTSTLLTATAATTGRSSTNTITWVVSLADAYFMYNTLLLSADTTVTTSSFANDASLLNNQPLIGGDVRASDYNPYTQGYYGDYFDGSGDYLTLAANAAFGFGTGDVTIEMWLYPSSTKNVQFLFDTRDNGNTTQTRYNLSLNNTNSMQPSFNVGVTAVATSNVALAVGYWYHLAVTRSGSTFRMFINGTQVASGTNSSDVGASSGPCIGTTGDARGNYDGYFQGYMSNLRVVKGQALYTANFTPSTTPLTTSSQSATAANVSLLTCQSNRLLDTSTNNFTITKNGDVAIVPNNPWGVAAPTSVIWSPSTTVTLTGTEGSGYFDGSGDYISYATTPITPIGTNSFTYEAWIYPTATGAQQGILSSYFQLVSPGDYGILLQLNSSNQISAIIQVSNASTLTLTNSTTTTFYAWTHVALTRSGTACTLWVNGTSVATGTFNGNMIGTTALVGSLYTNNTGAGYWFTGYIAGARIVNGTAIYTAAFTPPTSSLSAVTNTTLLTLQTGGPHNNSSFVDNSSSKNLLVRTGNASNGAFSPYGNNWSYFFDGTGDYLTVPYTTANFDWYSTGVDYTVEMWVYPTTFNGWYGAGGGSGPGAIGNMTGTAGTNYWSFGINLSGQATFFYYNGSAVYITSTAAVSINTWSHIAMTKTASGIKLFVNGVGNTPTAISGTPQSSAGTPLTMGAFSTGYVNGWISNARIVRGTAVYTSDFTPPTTPLTAIANTTLLTAQSNRFIDNSPNNLTLTISGDTKPQKFNPFSSVTVPAYYSGYFDGTGDYISIPDSNAFYLTGDFTVECWVWINNGTNSVQDIFCQRSGLGTGTVFAITYNGGVYQQWFWVDGTGITTVNTGNTITPNSWIHLAWTRSGNTVRSFINGTLNQTVTYAGTPSDVAAPMLLGNDSQVGTQGYVGYISNARITKGQALYTASFTPSTTPLTTTSQGATAANVSLLTCQSNTFIDNSLNYFTVTAAGDAKPLLVSPFIPTATASIPYSPATFGGSMYFDGNELVYVPTASNPQSAGAFTYSGDFTIEFWVYPTAAAVSTYNPTFFTNNASGDWASNNVGIRIQYGVVIFGSGGGFTTLTMTNPITQNAWNHIALVRSGSTVTLYKNGIANGTVSYSSTLGFNGCWPALATSDGAGTGGREWATGYFSDWRITSGKALYTANFYPSATPATPTYTIGTNVYPSNLLVNGNTGGVLDASRTVDMETVGNSLAVQNGPYSGSYYSVLFNASGDYLTIANNSALNILSGGDFTIEAWIYNTQSSPNNATIICSTVFGQGIGYAFRINSTRTMEWVMPGVAAYTFGPALATNTWYHVAVCRVGSVVTGYIGGTQYTFSSTNRTTDSGASTYIGGDAPNSFWWGGFISNLRVVKGQALYTATFTPSTAPLTTTSQGASAANVSLLTCQSNKFVDNSNNALTITPTSAPDVVIQNPFQANTGLSYYFDGSGDYLSLLNSPTVNFSSGDFTIEFWINPTSWFGAVYDQGSTNNLVIYRNNSTSTTKMGVRFNGVADFYSTADVPVGQWSYWALVRRSGTVTWYFNGATSGSTSYSTAIAAAAATIGYSAGFGISYTGYISDFRITNGVARYTSAFTPPTAPDKTS